MSFHERDLYKDKRFKKYDSLELNRNKFIERMGLAQYPIQLNSDKEQLKYKLVLIGDTGEVVVPFHGCR